MFISGSSPRGITGADARRWSTAPTDRRRHRSPTRSPQYPSTLATATHWPFRNRGCIGFSVQYRWTIGRGCGLVEGPPVGGAVLGRGAEVAPRHAGQPHRGGRVRAVRESALAHQVLLEACCRTGTCSRPGWRRRSRRSGATPEFGRGRNDSRCSVSRVVHGEPRLDRMPTEAVAAARRYRRSPSAPRTLDSLAADELPAHRPEPLRQSQLARAWLERGRAGRGAAVDAT